MSVVDESFLLGGVSLRLVLDDFRESIPLQFVDLVVALEFFAKAVDCAESEGDHRVHDKRRNATASVDIHMVRHLTPFVALGREPHDHPRNSSDCVRFHPVINHFVRRNSY